jgi:vitamin B12 transporter
VAPTTYIGQRLKFDLKQEIGIVEGEKLILGGEWQNDSMDTGTATYSVENKAVYAELESKLFDHFAVASNIRYDDNENFGGHATYRIAPTYTIAATDTQLKASYGTGFKSPSLSDLYQNYPAFGFYANPNLQPETSTGYDIGFEQPFLKDRIRIGSTYFHNDITNLIDYNATYTSLVNVGHAETYGTESFASYKVSDQFTIRADYTYTIARDLIADIDLARRPRDKATLQGNWTPFDKFHLSGTLLYVSSWLDVNPLTYASQTAPGYATVNFAASYELTKQATIFARVNNLFNRQYEDPLGYLHPGLAAYAGVRITSF